jgi:hypothetical protein
MCTRLKDFIETDLRPFVAEVLALYRKEGASERIEALEALEATFDEILGDIANGLMDAWECGELYEEFKRYRESGDFLDKIS